MASGLYGSKVIYIHARTSFFMLSDLARPYAELEHHTFSALYLPILSPTWAQKVCKIMAFRAIILGLGLLFYILLGSR